jgi:hypothetical protein
MSMGQQLMFVCLGSFSVMIIYLLIEEKIKAKKKPYDWEKDGI